jgi:DNA-binding FadR family transcriptional regulator
VDLAAKGLVTLIPRVGTMVNDYRKEGSLSLLTSLVNYHQGRLEPELLTGLLEMRQLFEVETARLAALNRTKDQLKSFYGLLHQEDQADIFSIEKISELDFNFHHLVALSSANRIYPLLLNSFKQCYINLAGQFFIDSSVVPEVFGFHKQMVQAFEDKDDRAAAQIMAHMLEHGAEQFFGKGQSAKRIAQRAKRRGQRVEDLGQRAWRIGQGVDHGRRRTGNR